MAEEKEKKDKPAVKADKPAAKAKKSEPKARQVTTGKRFTGEYQPSAQAKQMGKLKAEAKRRVMNELKEEFLNTLITIKDHKTGKTSKISALDAGLKKIVATYINNPDKMLRVLELISKYERDDILDTIKVKESKEKLGENENSYNDSFIQALNAKADDVWEEENKNIKECKNNDGI